MKKILTILVFLLAACTEKKKGSRFPGIFIPKYPANKTTPVIIQQIELEYLSRPAAGPHWVTPTDRARYRDPVQLAEQAIAVEPTDAGHALPDSFNRPGSVLLFTGGFDAERATKTRVFRYTGWEPAVNDNTRKPEEDSSSVNQK